MDNQLPDQAVIATKNNSATRGTYSVRAAIRSCIAKMKDMSLACSSLMASSPAPAKSQSPAQQPTPASVSPINHQLPSNSSATTKKNCHWLASIGVFVKAYCASFLIIGVIIPIVASFIEVGLYLTFSTPSPILGFQVNSQWYWFVYSSFLTVILWLVAALPYCYLSTAQGANPRNYTLLQSRLHQLKAGLGLKDHADSSYEEEIATIDTAMKCAGFDKRDEHTRGVVKEAYICCIDISQKLSKSSVGLTWIIGTGYNSAWALLHHAEEAMIEVADVDTVVRGARHDFLAIQGSQIDGKDELLSNVVQAVKELKPEALVYFKQPNMASNTPTQKEANARIALREVRSTLNDYRDKRWEGLVRQRNRLLKAIAVTGIVTHTLLCMTILAGTLVGIPPFKPFTLSDIRAGILTATMFYMVGAIAGLFVRFYSESQGNTSIDDFGLSTTRLVAIPLLSGIAGIMGVLVTEIFANVGGPALLSPTTAKPPLLPNLFVLDPRLLLTAAIFGVTPNLVIRGLQQKADEYQNQLQSSKAAETTAGSDT